MAIIGKINFQKIIANHLKNLAGFDNVFIDCPPSLAPTTVNALFAATHLIIPVQADKLSQSGIAVIKELQRETENTSCKHCLIWTQFDARNTVANKWLDEQLNGHEDRRNLNIVGNVVLNTRIRTDQAIVKATIASKSVIEHDPKSKGTEDYKKLAEEITKWVGSQE